MDVALDGRVCGNCLQEGPLADAQARILSPRFPSRVASVHPYVCNACVALLPSVLHVYCVRFERVSSRRGKEGSVACWRSAVWLLRH